MIIDETYLFPKNAERKLKLAQKMKQTAYLYGVTGIGKTALIKKYLKDKKYDYYSAEDTNPDKVRIPEEGGIIVIDDLHILMDFEIREEYKRVLEKILEQKNIWLILISRSEIPRWLYPLHFRFIFLTIIEQDFLFERQEQVQYFLKWNITLVDELQDYLWKLGNGNPLFLRLVALRIGGKSKQKEQRAAIEQGRIDLWDYLGVHVYDQWDMDLQIFLMETAIMDEFDSQMAAMITGKSNVEQLLLEAEEIGNFLLKRTNGNYYYRKPFQLSMKRRLEQSYPIEKRYKLFYNAARCYEIRNELLSSLKMYEECEDTDGIARVLIENAKQNPGNGHYYELKKYYLRLSEKEICQSPVLLAGISLLQAMLLNIEQSEYWYQKLTEYMESHTGNAKKEAKTRLLYLDIALPQRGIVNMVDIMKNAGTLILERKLLLPEFSVTSNLPSMMNGGKDFCEWSKKDKELANKIGKFVELTLGKYGKGLVSLALAESYLEKGHDNYEVATLIEKGKMQAESGGKIEQSFVAIGLLTWLSILNNRAADAIDILNTFEKKAEREAQQLLPNIKAFACRVNLYLGDEELVSEWMLEAPNEMEDFQGMDRFQYFMKVRIYLQQGELERAYFLLHKILYFAKVCKRTYCQLEANILLAILLYRQKREWKELLQQCITAAEEYHFVRIISREGQAVLELLKTEDFVWNDIEYKRQVLEECEKMAKYYPEYLKVETREIINLSENAISILRLQAKGMSTEKIAKELCITQSTVKYHCRETYRKLGVRDKAAAVNEARNRKIL